MLFRSPQKLLCIVNCEIAIVSFMMKHSAVNWEPHQSTCDDKGRETEREIDIGVCQKQILVVFH